MLLRMVGVLCVMVGYVTAQRDDVISAQRDDVTPRDVFPGIGEYFFIGLAANWTEAFRVCQSGNAHTVIIDSDPEKDAILTMMQRNSISLIHLGFHDQFVEGNYETLLGKSVEDTCGVDVPWAPGAPQGGTEFNCGGFTEAGFTDTRCDARNGFICEINNPDTEGLFPGYTLLPDFGLFKLYTEGVTWGDSDATCRDDGGHLVILNSQDQADALRDAFELEMPYAYWVGVHRYFGGNDNFVTVTGGSLNETDYATWALTHPFGDFIADPFVMYLESNFTVGLGTNTDNAALRFICEVHVG